MEKGWLVTTFILRHSYGFGGLNHVLFIMTDRIVAAPKHRDFLIISIRTADKMLGTYIATTR